MKRLIAFSLVFVALTCLVTGCGTEQVSENAKTVINTIMNCPNLELWNEDSALILGTTEISEEEKARRKALAEEIDANWVSAVGECFSPGSLDPFLTSPAALYFFGESEVTGNTYEVKSMSLIEKTDTEERVSVVLLENGEEITVEVVFLLNPDGLFYRVRLPELIP